MSQTHALTAHHITRNTLHRKKTKKHWHNPKLTSVERYAIRFLESSGAYITLEQINAARMDVEMCKRRTGNLATFKLLKKEEEKRAAEEEDEILYTLHTRGSLTGLKKNKSKSNVDLGPNQ
ncbi:hypothetical protein OS493_039360 [Desmophyllum pertusum]|uniref:Uncharacterized protein n=1 Tax=Desmophyllum pertusum TaxID=174260 RepID=A0A9W9ZIR7_9CNID|nr:hypothetical protein OS493_039360 [Desmophyllum pertusum]